MNLLSEPICQTVPVELISFTGTVEEEGNLLKWVTATEINNDYFTLEHSIDGVTYNRIDQTEGAGTTSELQSYGHMHYDAPPGLSYYRLKQTDFDGTTKEVGVIKDAIREAILDGVIPNAYEPAYAFMMEEAAKLGLKPISA